MKKCLVAAAVVALAFAGFERDAEAAWWRLQPAMCTSAEVDSRIDPEEGWWANWNTTQFEHVECPLPYASFFQTANFTNGTWFNNVSAIWADVSQGNVQTHVEVDLCVQHDDGSGDVCTADNSQQQYTTHFWYNQLEFGPYTTGSNTIFAQFPYDYPFAVITLPPFNGSAAAFFNGLFIATIN